MNLTLKFRDRMYSIGSWFVTEMDQLTGAIRNAWDVEHDDDGHHTDITADTLTTTGKVTVGGDESVAGALAVTGAITAAATHTSLGDLAVLGAILGGYGIKLGDWRIIEDRVSGTANVRVEYTATAGADTFAVRVGVVAGGYTLRGDTGISLNLGDSSNRLNQIETADAHALNGYTERGRTPKLGEWTSYTPTWTSLTVGNGTVAANYSQVGKTTFFKINVIFGTTTAITAANLQPTFPVTAIATSSFTVAKGEAIDSSAGTTFPVHARLVSGTNMILLADNGVSLVAISATVPFTWAVSDELHLYGMFESS